jgi:hypothetical protein
LEDRIHPEDRAARAQVLERVMTNGESMTHEYRITRPDRSVRWIRDTAFPIRNSGGGVGQLGGIAHDISRRDLLSVYVVEPEPSAREAKSVLLTRAGQKVTTFASEAAFIEVAAGCVLVRTVASSRGGPGSFPEIRSRG